MRVSLTSEVIEVGSDGDITNTWVKLRNESGHVSRIYLPASEVREVGAMLYRDVVVLISIEVPE